MDRRTLGQDIADFIALVIIFGFCVYGIPLLWAILK